VEKGRFRADLLDRLSFEVVTLPPLRARIGDVPVLAEHFGRRMASEIGWSYWPGFGERAAAALAAHDWPGNVRELRNVVERAVYRWDDSERPVDEIVFDPFASPWRPVSAVAASTASSPVAAPSLASTDMPCDDLRAAVDAHERAILEAAMRRARYNQRAAAAALKLSYDQLRHALRRHGLLEKPAG
jgi:psp operon transcriptional activator